MTITVGSFSQSVEHAVLLDRQLEELETRIAENTQTLAGAKRTVADHPRGQRDD